MLTVSVDKLAEIQQLWGMLYDDDAGIVLRSPGSLEGMMPTILRVSGLFRLMVSERETDITSLLPKGMEECPFRVNTSGPVYKHTSKHLCLGVIVCEGGKVDTEMASRLSRAWGCYRRNGQPMYDHRELPPPAQSTTAPS